MTSTIFFFAFIPLLALILLAVNLIFAPHSPYMEKEAVFECGFSSFLGQNRTQFSISFFIFALLFLLFDLEILLVYPYLVSAYTNDVYGLAILLMFLLALTLGFAFELGKKALSIDSRQGSSEEPSKASTSLSSIALVRILSWPIPHSSIKLPLKSGFLFPCKTEGPESSVACFTEHHHQGGLQPKMQRDPRYLVWSRWSNTPASNLHLGPYLPNETWVTTWSASQAAPIHYRVYDTCGIETVPKLHGSHAFMEINKALNELHAPFECLTSVGNHYGGHAYRLADLDLLISLCVGLGLAIASILTIGGLILLMEGLASSSHTNTHAHKVDHKGKSKEDDEDKIVVNLSYVISETYRKLPVYTVYDKNDPYCINLKRLYPLDGAKVVDVNEPKLGLFWKGLQWPNGRNNWLTNKSALESTLFKEESMGSGSLKCIKISSPSLATMYSFRRKPTILSLGKPISQTIDGKK